ncbi:MAG: hypothetical protein FJ290_07925 [Planctomycetes bacterium]|nr:hypothetical protein [Planctomycetota bacterium]
MRNVKWAVYCLALFGVGASRAQEADAEIDGRPVSQWVKQLRSENRGLQLRAARALANAPAGARARIVPLLVPVLRSERENDKFVAAQVLGEYGPMARLAVPDLLPMLQGTQAERNRAAAAKALGQILKDAKPDDEVEKAAQALMAAFDDKYSDVRREAVTACGMIGPAAKACIPLLPKRLVDRSLTKHPWEEQAERALVERAAAWTCGRMGKLAAVHIDRLIVAMQANHPQPTEFVDAIAEIGAVQDNVVPNITDKLEKAIFGGYQGGSPEENDNYRVHCLLALERFGGKSAPAVPLLVRCLELRQFSPKQATVAARMIKGLGPAAADAAPVLKEYLDAKDRNELRLRDITQDELVELQKLCREALDALGSGKAAGK